MMNLYDILRRSRVATGSRADKAITLFDRINGYASLKTIAQNTVSVVATNGNEFLGNGSGLYFSDLGYVLTASHIALEIAKAPQAHVYFPDGLVSRVESMDWRSKECDAAILKITPLEKKRNVNIGFSRSDDITDFMGVTTFGYQATQQYTSRGVVNDINGIITSPHSFGTAVPGLEGFSGGPMANKKAEIVGINSYGMFGDLGAARIYSALPQIDRILRLG